MEVHCPHCEAYFDAWIVSRSGPCPRCGKPLSSTTPEVAEAQAQGDMQDDASPAGTVPPQDYASSLYEDEPEEPAPPVSPAEETPVAPAAPVKRERKPPAKRVTREPPPPAAAPAPKPAPQPDTAPPQARPVKVYAVAIAAILCAVGIWYLTKPGRVELTVSPVHALVSIDGNTFPSTNGTLSGRLANGEHLLHVSCDGWVPLDETFSVRRGRTTRRQVNLKPLSGLLQVTADQGGAELTLMRSDGTGVAAGRLNGETLPISGILLPITVEIPMGDYRATVTKSGFSAASVKVAVPGGRELVQLNIPLTDERGHVTVSCIQKGLQASFFGPKPADTPAATLTLTPGVTARVDLTAGEYDVHFADQIAPHTHWPSQRTVTVLPRGEAHLSADLESRILWSFRTRGPLKAAVSLADLNNDGTPDAIFGSSDKYLYAVDGRDAKPLWSSNVGAAIEQYAVIANLNEDATLDCLVASAAGSVCAVSGADGSFLWKVRIGTPLSSIPPLVADLDVDGFADYVVVSASETGLVIRALSGGSGDELWCHETTQEVFSLVELTDRTADGVADLVIGEGSANRIVINGTDGQPVAAADETVSEPAPAFGTGHLPPAADATIPEGLDILLPAAQADLNGDGITDFIAASGDTVYAFSGRPPRMLMGLFVGGKIDLVGAAFLDGDKTPDIIVASADGSMTAFSGANGQQLNQPAGAATRPTGQSADLDGTSSTERFLISEDGLLVQRKGTPAEPAWAFKPMGRIRNLPTAADLTGDGTKDCLVATVSGWMHGIDGRTGDMIWTSYLGGQNPSRVAAGDINGDGAEDAIIALPDVGLFAFSGRRGELLWSSRTSRGTYSDPALADLNGDGRLDVILAFSDGTIQVTDGQAWRGWSSDKPVWSIGGVKVPATTEPVTPPTTCEPYTIGWQNMVVVPK